MKKAKDQPESEPAELASLVGERIRKIRKEEGLSLELFALRCDMNVAYVGHIERGVQNPTLNTLERICKGLDISVEDLFMDKSATVDMNTAALQYFSQVTRDLSPEQFHRLLNIIKEIVAVSRVPIKQYLQKFPKWGRFGVTSVTPFLLLPVHPEGCTPAHRT